MAGCVGLVEVVESPQIDGVRTLGTHRVLQTVVDGKPATGELYNYVAGFGDFLVIVTANPLVLPDKPVAPVNTQRARDLLAAAVAAVEGLSSAHVAGPELDADPRAGRAWTSSVSSAPRCAGRIRPSPADRRDPAAVAASGPPDRAARNAKTLVAPRLTMATMVSSVLLRPMVSPCQATLSVPSRYRHRPAVVNGSPSSPA